MWPQPFVQLPGPTQLFNGRHALIDMLQALKPFVHHAIASADRDFRRILPGIGHPSPDDANVPCFQFRAGVAGFAVTVKRDFISGFIGKEHKPLQTH